MSSCKAKNLFNPTTVQTGAAGLQMPSKFQYLLLNLKIRPRLRLIEVSSNPTPCPDMPFVSDTNDLTNFLVHSCVQTAYVLVMYRSYFFYIGSNRQII